MADVIPDHDYVISNRRTSSLAWGALGTPRWSTAVHFGRQSRSADKSSCFSVTRFQTNPCLLALSYPPQVRSGLCVPREVQSPLEELSLAKQETTSRRRFPISPFTYIYPGLPQVSSSATIYGTLRRQPQACVVLHGPWPRAADCLAA